MADSYTHQQLKDVKDSAPEYGLGDAMEARFAREALDAEQTGVSYHRIKPGQRQGIGHRHDEDEEIYVIVRGSGLIKLDDEIIEIEELDAIRISPEVVRALEAGDEGIEFLAFGTHREGDGEVIPGWWSE
jgi:mannose-6-phosphate isomerase-like protein (cupin superfamily)